MKKIFKPIPVALIFALLIIASSYFLKKTVAGDWVDAAIYLVGGYYFFRYATNSHKVCR